MVDRKIKEPWVEHSHIWKNESSWWTYLRGCLRKAWNRNPVKLSLINEKRYQIANPNPNAKKKTVWGFKCDLCGQEYPIKDGQVDHLHEAGKLNRIEDIQAFVVNLLFVSKTDLRLICKGCHGAVTYAQKHGMSLEEARATKMAIDLCNNKKDLQWLRECGIIPASSRIKRREQIVNHLLRGEDE